METLVIEKTTQSPEILFQADGNLLIKGISITNNVQKFYEPLLEWLTKFKQFKPKQINLVLELYYLNTSSSLILVDILKTLRGFKDEGSELSIIWKYEEDDEDIFDLGEDIRMSSKCEFEFMVIDQ